MSRSILLLRSALKAFAAAFAATLLLSCRPAAPVPEMQIDWQPPSFQLTGQDGRVFHYPEDVTGPTIVLFWATWCPYCKALMPHLQSIVDESEGTIEVLALDIRDDMDPATYLAEYGYDFRLFPNSDAVADAWGIKGTPGLFLVDSDGRAVFSNYAIPPEAFEHSPRELVAEMKNYQKAARRAPVWAAELRKAIDRTLQLTGNGDGAR